MHQGLSTEGMECTQGGAAWFRLVRRATLLLSMTGLVVLVRWVLFPLVVSSSSFEQKSRRLLFRTWGRCALRILGLRLHVRGNPPPRPFFLVCNHQSYVDVFVMAACLGCVFVAMVEMRSWPIVRRLNKLLRTIYVDRRKVRDAQRVNEAMCAAWDLGESMAIFPEGGTSPGIDVRPFRSPLLQPAAEHGWPVHCAAIHYATPENTPPADHAVIWAHREPFAAHFLRLLRVPRADITVTFVPESVAGDDRKTLTARLHDAVSKAFLGMKTEAR